MYKILWILFLTNFQDFFKFAKSTTTVVNNKKINICDDILQIELTKFGESSSVLISLLPKNYSNNDYDNFNSNYICKLKIIGPRNHVISMQFIETSAQIQKALIYNNSEQHPPCVMNVFLPKNPRIPVWKGDPCSSNSLTEIDLLTPEFKLIWSPSTHHSHTKGRKILLTVVGQGETCKEPDYHTCMRIGWDPLLCISNHLICNGITNCPKGTSTSDEDETLCSHTLAQPTWEQLAVEIFRKLKPPSDINNKWLQDKVDQHSSTTISTTKKSFLNWSEWQNLKKLENTTTEKSTTIEKSENSTIVKTLSKYGPWGYLMLGMLICGVVLMFCGFWECCFKDQKNTTNENTTTSNQPTTVLIINRNETNTISPPNYEDLDQPPSYTALFPNYKRDSQIFDRSDNNTDNNSVNRTANDDNIRRNIN